MGMFSMMQISASALTAERQRARGLLPPTFCNAEDHRTLIRRPYVRKEPVFSATNGNMFHAAFHEGWWPRRRCRQARCG